MKFKLVEDNLVTSKSGNWMVDAPEEKSGEIDWYAYKEEKAEGCPYRKFYRGEYWCVYNHFKKQNTTDQDIDDCIENNSDEEIAVCPSDIEGCPIERWSDVELNRE